MTTAFNDLLAFGASPVGRPAAGVRATANSDMVTAFTILAISGSARAQSHSRASLLAAAQLLPPDVQLKIVDLQDIPMRVPGCTQATKPAVQALKQGVRAADAVLFAVPEYVYGLLTVLDNAIDSVAWPLHDNPWDGKPVALIGVTEAARAPAQARHHLLQRLLLRGMVPAQPSALLVCKARDAFDAGGGYADATLQTAVRHLLRSLVGMARAAKAQDGLARPTAACAQACV